MVPLPLPYLFTILVASRFNVSVVFGTPVNERYAFVGTDGVKNTAPPPLAAEDGWVSAVQCSISVHTKK